jgi:hypothetical protein
MKCRIFFSACILALAGAPDASFAQGANTPPQAGPPPAGAQPAAGLADSGRLLATGGVTQVEGAAGGGLVPWAVIAGYGTRDSIGGTAFGTAVPLRNYTLYAFGAAIGVFDRVELSYARHIFDTRGTGARLGIGRDYTFEQDILGAKLRLFGDIVYDQDTWLPQVAIGANYKVNHNSGLLRTLGARRDSDAEFYVVATKLILSESLLLNGAVRFTRANQFGLLGFGGPRNDNHQAMFEGTAALLLSRHLAVGAEYRMKPDNLAFAKEGDGFDVFAAYFVTKNVAATLAYANLGPIATQQNQHGVYLSLQLGF